MEHVAASYAQQRLWFVDRLMGGGSAYTVGHAWALCGRLDVGRLCRALNEVVRRHEVLRTRFVERDGELLQCIEPTDEWPLLQEDLGALPAEERDAEARLRVQSEAGMPFDLARGPLLRARLLRLEDEEHWLVLTLHHIVTDAWSMAVLLKELAALYTAFGRGQGSPLPALPVQYSDYALWQRGWLQGEVLARQLLYWRRTLLGMPALELPTDRVRPAVASYRGGQVHFEIEETLTGQLKALSRREGATLFMTLLAAYYVLMGRYSRQEDIAVGVPIAGRGPLELEGLIGFFVNTLVLRGDLSGEPNFRELLGRVRQRSLEAYVHQDLPFAKLVEELAPKRDLSRNPLFETCFGLRPPSSEVLMLEGVVAQHVRRIPSDSARFDLTFILEEAGAQLRGSAEYASDLFDRSTIERMVDHFTALLKGIVAHPEAPIGELPLLTPEEQEQLLMKENVTLSYYPRDLCIHQLFEAQVARTPDAVAVVFEDRQLTYAELNARANQLAHYLRTLGVGPDVLVGLCLERSLELVVGMLGILKAGGAYVPLDPSYPAQRIAFMLADAAVPVLLTQSSLRDTLPPNAAARVCLDAPPPELQQQSVHNPVPVARPDHLAYVIYTSGSTGTPKGVMVTHANVVRLFSATASWFGFGEHDVWTCFHSAAFDFSVWEIWGALLHGGRLVMVSYLVSRDPDAFHALLRREHVTVLNQTPSAFRQLTVADDRTDAAADLDLRLVILGGEALELQSLRPWFDRHGDSRPQLVNMYGITETTVHVTYRPIRRCDLGGTPRSLIGERIPDLRVHVLDRHLQPVPIGVPGEIVVGGAGVARGYLNRAELTAARFIADPFTGSSTDRLYRSGDLARRLPNGELEYLGRLDRQIKLRGFRIEPGEIEAVLIQCPSVQEATVQLREDSRGNPRLVAYVVPLGETLSVVDLRASLKRQLPDYMHPAAFVQLRALPLTPNGKIDRKALPLPQFGDIEIAYRSPGTLVEEAIANAWIEVLKLPRVGIDDNFFDLGGHSLLAVRLLYRIKDTLNIELTLRQIFETPTVRGLALAALDKLVIDIEGISSARSSEKLRGAAE